MPSSEKYSGWFTFTNNENYLNCGSLYWWYTSDSSSGLPYIDGDAYCYPIKATLAYPVNDYNHKDWLGDYYRYSTIKEIRIIDAGNDYGEIYYVFSNVGTGYDEILEFTVCVFNYDDGWVHDNYRQILLPVRYYQTDFINFLSANGGFGLLNNSTRPNKASTFTELLLTYVDIPLYVMHGMLDIDLLGTTLFAVIMGIITIIFIIYLIKRLL